MLEKTKISMRYCKKCTYPESGVNISFDEKGVSSTFNTFQKWKSLSEKNGNVEREYLKN